MLLRRPIPNQWQDALRSLTALSWLGLAHCDAASDGVVACAAQLPLLVHLDLSGADSAHEASLQALHGHPRLSSLKVRAP